jgi:uncharacterized LabA/DUF88 family protein
VAAERVAVFLDFQNVHLVGHGLFGGALEPYEHVPNPRRLGDLLAGRRSRQSTAEAIRVYRAQPVADFQPTPARVNDAQAAEWTRDRRVQMITRPLVYPGWTAATRHLPQQRPYEKGIDVAIAVDMMHFAFRRLYDALILFSSDTDLMPPLETITSLGLTHVEVACWRGGSQLRFPGTRLPWCHTLSEQDWSATVDDWKSRA